MRFQSKDYIVEYDYSHVPTIAKFAASDKKIRAIMGCYGSGKSSGCVMEIMRRSFLQRPSPDGIRRTRWVVIRNHYGQLRDTTIKTFHAWFPPQYFGEWKTTEHVYLINRFEGVHIEVLFRALDTPESISNVASLDVTGAWINEAREIDKEIFDAIEARTGRYPKPSDGGCTWHGVIMDTNPPDVDSWFYHYFEELKPEKAELFKQPSGLSPQAENIKNLPPNYYIDMCVGKDQNFIDVYVHGKYGYSKQGKPVYNNYNDSLHVASTALTPYKGIDLIIGIDFGMNPAAAICQLTPRGKFLVLDEVVGENMGIRSFINTMLKPMLVNKYRDMKAVFIGDPSGVNRGQTDERSCFDELISVGFKVIPAKTNALIPRLDAIEFLLSRLVDGEPCFQLSPTCKILRQGFNGKYRFRKVHGRSDRYTDTPEKNMHSHIHDALQYAGLYVDELYRPKKVNAPIISYKKYTPASIAGY